MCFSDRIVILLTAAVLATPALSQTTPIFCSFSTVNSVYRCLVLNHKVSDNENQKFIIEGNHSGNNNDSTVHWIQLIDTNAIPFIINEFFVRFTNAFSITIFPSGLTRIQTRAFAGAKNLRQVTANGNPLRTIQADAFLGASSLRTIDLQRNQLQFIDEDAFRGLASLRNLLLENNHLRYLHRNLFRPLTNVESIYLSRNYLQTINGRMFINHNQLREIDFSRNRINEIGRSVLDGLSNLHVFNAFGNNCVNNVWLIDDSSSLDTIRIGLEKCFHGFDAMTRLRMKVRGTVQFFDEYDNEIVTL